jgi:hypothetical protein
LAERTRRESGEAKKKKKKRIIRRATTEIEFMLLSLLFVCAHKYPDFISYLHRSATTEAAERERERERKK